MELLYKSIFGSHLYGTATVDSDRDYKGVFMPSLEEIYLGKIPKSLNISTKKGDEKNTPEDIDTEYYSLHYFIHLACEGETVALDMLHTPSFFVLESSYIWNKLIEQREKFYTKNLKAFIGYARRQASKYGIKGSRLNAAKNVCEFLAAQEPDKRMAEIWDSLPEGEHIYKHPENANGFREYEVCGRKTQETASTGYSLSIFQKFYENYGKRAEQAARNEGIDWKAVSHALRAAFQVKEILVEQNITFPLREADYLLSVKRGELHYAKEVAPRLDSLMDEVEILSERSLLPIKADRRYWHKFIIRMIEEFYGIRYK